MFQDFVLNRKLLVSDVRELIFFKGFIFCIWNYCVFLFVVIPSCTFKVLTLL